MKKYTKYIIAAAVAALAIIITVAVVRKVHKKARAQEIVSLIVTKKEKLAEMVTYRYCRDTVLFETEKPSQFVALFTDTPDTVAVFIARPTVCAGVDLRKLMEEDVRVSGDTLYVNLPAPEILDVYLNHSDLKQVYAAWDWKLDDKLGPMAEKAKAGIRRDALRQGILQKAGIQAERSLSSFLSQACRMPVVVTVSQTSPELPGTLLQ